MDIEKKMDDIADGFVMIDLVNKNTKPFRKSRFLELINNPSERNQRIWNKYKGPLEVTYNQLLDVLPVFRNQLWFDMFTRLFACSRRQARIEKFMRPFLVAAEKASAKTKDTFRGESRSEAIAAAKKGVGKDRFIKREEKLVNGTSTQSESERRP